MLILTVADDGHLDLTAPIIGSDAEPSPGAKQALPEWNTGGSPSPGTLTPAAAGTRRLHTAQLGS